MNNLTKNNNNENGNYKNSESLKSNRLDIVTLMKIIENL